MDLIILAVFAVIALLGIAATLWGVDSRPSFNDARTDDTWSRAR